METHIASGKHKYQPKKLSILDNAAHLYKTQLENAANTSSGAFTKMPIVPSSSVTSIIPPNALRQGWALPEAKSSIRFTKEQIEFLVDKFNDGEETGRKWDPTAVSLVMQACLRFSCTVDDILCNRN